MSFIPGADGNKSIFKDGIQVNVISENTLNAGVHVQGATDGNTIPAGYIGESYESLPTSGAWQTGVSGQNLIWNGGAGTPPSITVSAGKWLFHGHVEISIGAGGGAMGLRFWNNTASSAFGGGSTTAGVTVGMPVSATGILNCTVSTTVYLYGIRTTATTVTMGDGGPISSGGLWAIRIA